eukprot:1140623-Pelagomonas_calceolata.AAC.2
MKAKEILPTSINQGKGYTLAQESRESPPPQSYRKESPSGNLEGHWNLSAPGPGCEQPRVFTVLDFNQVHICQSFLSHVQEEVQEGTQTRGIWRLCCANLSPLPMLTKPDPQELLLRALMIILPATLWRSIFMLEMI